MTRFEPIAAIIEIFIRELPDKPVRPFILSIDGKIFQLKDSDWIPKSHEGYDVSETFSIINPIMVDDIVKHMRGGNKLRVLFDGWNEVTFQLRGISSALDAIEVQIEKSLN